MLPVCSAAPNCSSHSQAPYHVGLRSFSLLHKDFDVNWATEGRTSFCLSFGNHIHKLSYKTHAAKSLPTYITEISEQAISAAAKNLCDTSQGVSNSWSSLINEETGSNVLRYIDNSSTSTSDEELVDFTDQLDATVNVLSAPVETENMTRIDITPENSTSVSDMLKTSSDSLSDVKGNEEDLISGLNESINASVNKEGNAVKDSLDRINLSLTSLGRSVAEAVENATNGVFSTADKSAEIASNGVTSFSSNLKDATSKATIVAVDALRYTIVAVENSLANGASFVVYSYGSAKEMLAPESRDVINVAEERATKIFSPVVIALQQVYATIEDLERSLGLDPNDPITPFVLFAGTSTTLWVLYWVWTYSGYSGDLSPSSAAELLRGKENAALIDVRPEDLREKDGIPDLRRTARFRYASVNLPEVDKSLRKLLSGGRDLDNVLTAAVIRSLKIVRDRSKVVVMDADGVHSKGIARALRKLGVKKPYVLKGGFQSWVKDGLRTKELKPETTLTILNEEAEAILEDINPSPFQVIAFGVGVTGALYALLEWEKTLQFIGVMGLGQTIYRRVASYEDAEDFKEDVRLLLAPARVGARAFSWAAGKLETNGVKLPTSPSSPDVQNRVLQAAAKHESQPADSEAIQDPSPEQATLRNENIDLS